MKENLVFLFVGGIFLLFISQVVFGTWLTGPISGAEIALRVL